MLQNIVRPSFSSEVYSVPGKVFVLGEYAILAGLPALVATLSPRFSMTIRKGPRPLSHPDSPVERLMSWAKQRGLPDLSFEFQDPWNGAGGFGYSTAQFAMVYLALVQKAGTEERRWPDVWKLYRELTQDQPLRPSGADLVAQWQGGVTYFDPGEKIGSPCSTMDLWSLFDWSGFLVFSATHQEGRKVATHEHLAILASRDFPGGDRGLLQELESSLRQGVAAIQDNESAVLGKAMSAYAESLARVGLEAPATRADREVLRNLRGVLGVKGAGAMQSDAVLVLMQPRSPDRDVVIRTAQERGLQLVSEGLTCQMGVMCQTVE